MKKWYFPSTDGSRRAVSKKRNPNSDTSSDFSVIFCYKTFCLQCFDTVRKSIRPVNIEWWGADVVICLQRGADCLHMVKLIPLSSPSSLASFKSRLVLPFWYRLKVVLEKRPLNRCTSSYVCNASVQNTIRFTTMHFVLSEIVRTSTIAWKVQSDSLLWGNLRLLTVFTQSPCVYQIQVPVIHPFQWHRKYTKK